MRKETPVLEVSSLNTMTDNNQSGEEKEEGNVLFSPRTAGSLGEDLLGMITEQIEEYVVNITEKIKVDKNYRERTNTIFRERANSDLETKKNQQIVHIENENRRRDSKELLENPELPFRRTTPKLKLKNSSEGSLPMIGTSKFGVVPQAKISRLISTQNCETLQIDIGDHKEETKIEPFNTGNSTLDCILNNSFKSGLFTNYLQSNQSEPLLEIFIDIYRCKEKRAKEMDEDYEPFIKATIIGVSVVKIFQKYLTHDSLPSSIKDELRVLAFPFLTTEDELPVSRSSSFEDEDQDQSPISSSLDSSTSSEYRFSGEFKGEIFDDEVLINSLAESLIPEEEQSNKNTQTKIALKIVDGTIFNSVEEKISVLLNEYLERFLSDNRIYRSNTRAQSKVPENSLLMLRKLSTLESREFTIYPDDPFEVLDSSENIRFLPDSNTIEFASLEKLIQRITHPNAIIINGDDFQSSFLYTYRYFSNTEETISLLRTRLHYITLPPMNLSESNLVKWKKTKLLPTVIRITGITKLLVETHVEYFRKEPAQKDIILNFVSEDIQKVMSSAAQNLMEFINKKIAIREKINISDFQFDKKPPKPKLKKKYIGKPLTFSMIYIIELARQMTLLDFRLYRSIRVEECLNMNWTRKNKEKDSPNVLAFIRQFCNNSLWVAHTILLKRDIEKRVKILAKMIQLSDANLKLNNFNGAMAVYCGIRNHSIIRLKKTWELLPKVSWDQWEELEKLFKCDANFATLRGMLQESSFPAIPYLGLFLSDLTFIDNEENFNPEAPKLINFSKMQFIGGIMNQILKFQTSVYCLEEVDILQQYLLTLKPPDENELYKLSTARETRNGQILRKSKRGKKKR